VRPRVKLDVPNGVGYVTICPGEGVATIELTPSVLADVDSRGRIIGFELMGFELELIAPVVQR
jgi:uncharacterized protein YuzE